MTEQPNTSESLLAPGAAVDHYKVLRLAGRGGMGEVYLARDTQLGRKVALKLVRAEALVEPQARERFLVEARAAAQLNHPHVVTVYGVGEHQGAPYLAMEFLEGRTLEERLEESQPSLGESLRLGLAIAEAIEEAHAHQILHRDLKPANVVIPKDGRVRVVDFGLAKFVGAPDGEGEAPTARGPARAEATSSTLCGTPLYMSPEQWSGRPGTGADDVWALGLVLHELFTGRSPLEGLSIPQIGARVRGDEPLVSKDLALPADLLDLLSRCLAKQPEGRPDAGGVARALREAIAGTRQDSGVARPFRGLLPFSEQHAGLFFGRRAEVEAFLERLRDEPVLPVVGPSGAGKSSFVQAGVIPRLREQGRWIVLRLRPGRHPFRALAARLRAGERASLPSLRSDETLRAQTQRVPELADAHGEDTEQVSIGDDEKLAVELQEEPTRLALWLIGLAEKERSPVLLFVDQLEEVFTLGAPDEAVAFVEALASAADDPQGPVRVIFTLRDDFLGRAAGSQQAREALSRVTVLRAPGPEALAEILTRPVAALGYRYDSADLVEKMVAEVRGEAAALSLLQFAGEMLWEKRDRKERLLRREAYEQMGGVAGALAAHADGVLAGLADDELAVARALLLRLVTQDGYRRMLRRSQALEGLGPRAPAVLDRLVESRMVLARKGAAEGGEVAVELVHEALVRVWARLARWIDESRDDLVFLEDAERAADLWERRGRPRDEVWRGEALEEALRRADRLGERVPRAVNAFLEAGERAAWRRGRRNRRAVAAVIAALVGVAIVLLVQNRKVAVQRARAEDREAAALLEGARTAWLRDDGLEARAKLRVALEARDGPKARGLWWQLERSPVIWERPVGPFISDIAVSRDGRLVAAAKQDSSVAVLDTITGTTRYLRGHADQVLGLTFSSDGRRLATQTWGGEVGLWDLASGELRLLSRDEPGGLRVAFSPDGRQVASTRSDGTVRLWDAASGARVRTFAGHAAPSAGVVFAPDGSWLAATANDGALRAWDLATGAERLSVKAHAGRTNALAVSPDGALLATGGHDRTVKVWEAATGRLRFSAQAHEARVTGAAFSRAGSVLASVSVDRSVRLWDVATGVEKALLRDAGSPVNGVGFGPGDAYLAAGAADGTLHLLRPRALALAQAVSALAQREVSFSPDGAQIAAGPEDGLVQLWDAATGVLTRVIPGHTGAVHGLAYSADGTMLATGAEDRLVRLWDPRTGALVRVLEGHAGELLGGLALTADGRRLASASGDGTVRAWSPSDGTVLWTAPLAGVRKLAYSRDGAVLAAASVDGATRLLDGATGALKATFRDHADELWGVDIGVDGQLASSGSDGRIVVRDLAAGTQRVLGPLGARAYWLSFSPDGRRLGVPLSDGTAQIIDLASGETVVLRGHRNEVNALRFRPDGRQVVTSSDDGTLRVWDALTGRPVWRAPLLRGEPSELYTHRGWARLDGEKGAGGPERWRRAVEESALLASQSQDGRRLCLSTFAGELQLWDLEGDRKVAAADAGPLRSLYALPRGCVSLSWAGKASLHLEDGSARALAPAATAVAWDGGRILVAEGREIASFDEGGAALERRPVDLGATALAHVGPFLAAGFKDGNVELVPAQDGQARPEFRFEDTPPARVERLLAGPMGTLIAGYANGMVGVWDAADGARLHLQHLHGPVAHLSPQGEVIHAATELGDHAVIDLRDFRKGWCELLREVWRGVPVVWEKGHPVARPPPQDHPCAP